MDFYSQDGQDKFIVNLFKKKESGYFLDVGAFDGVTYSNTYVLEKELDWKGICIEPNPLVYETLRNNRTCISLNCCVSSRRGTVKFLSVSGWGSMLSGIKDMFDQRHFERIDKIIEEHGGNKTIIEVPALPLEEIFDQHSITTIDYCNIDVEGGEIGVLKSIDFSKVKIRVFTIENNYRTKQLRKFLVPKGYRLIGKLGADEVYELNSKRYGLMLKIKIGEVRDFIGRTKRGLKRRIGISG